MKSFNTVLYAPPPEMIDAAARHIVQRDPRFNWTEAVGMAQAVLTVALAAGEANGYRMHLRIKDNGRGNGPDEAIRQPAQG